MYDMTYTETGQEQANVPVQHSKPLSVEPNRRRRFFMPTILKTTTTFATAGMMFFGLEGYAPPEYRPSTLMGTYESRVIAQVKAAELQQQAHYEQWGAQVKASVEQQSQQYKAVTEGIVGNYQATYDRGKILTQALGQIQQTYLLQLMQQKRTHQSADDQVIALSRLWGRFKNYLEPGSGDDALGYADDLSAKLADELTAAVTRGVTVEVEGWDTGLASADQIRRDLERVKPITIPPLPVISSTRSAPVGDQ